jgi:hypothetical protein
MPVNLVLWNQKIFEFGLEITGAFAIAAPPLEWGSYSVNLKATCPGAAFCGNPDADENCSIFKKAQVSLPGFSISLPSLAMKIPSFVIKFAFPPSVIIPLSCPNYPDATEHQDQVPEVNPIPSLGGDKYGFKLSFP